MKKRFDRCRSPWLLSRSSVIERVGVDVTTTSFVAVRAPGTAFPLSAQPESSLTQTGAAQISQTIPRGAR